MARAARLAGAITHVCPCRAMGRRPGQVGESRTSATAGQVERVARHLAFKGFNAALTEHHFGISAGQQVLRRQEPFFYAGGRAALEQDRLA